MGAEYEAAREVRDAILILDDTVGQLVAALLELNRLAQVELLFSARVIGPEELLGEVLRKEADDAQQDG